MTHKIKVGVVNYLNTKPLIYGFEQGMMKEEVELILDYPAAIAEKLLNNEIDIGLVPVAILPNLHPHYIVGEYGIACNGEVASVCLFSKVPLQEVDTILLDYQSRTSVQLLQILLKEYWKISPKLVAAYPNYEKDIKENVAGLVIGDRAFKQHLLSKYSYDLGQAWKDMTGLPFVFAAWLSTKKMSDDFIKQFNAANAIGFNYIDEIAKANSITEYDLARYYKKNVDYK
nr:menaquinone biosynthesis protein [Ferruginibacter sp.]